MEKADENKVKMDLFYTLLKQSDIEHTCIIFVAGNDNHFDDYKKIQTNGITFTNIIQVKDYRDGIGIYDEFDLYKTVFDITDYPSVLYYDGELKVEAMAAVTGLKRRIHSGTIFSKKTTTLCRITLL